MLRVVNRKQRDGETSATLRWQIARVQLDGIPRTLATRPAREFWSEQLGQATVAMRDARDRAWWVGLLKQA